MITSSLVSYLLDYTPITDLVGQAIQPPPAPANLNDYPCVTYQVASYVLEYAGNGSIGVSQSRIIYNCFGTSYLQAASIAQALIAVLSGYTGDLPDGTRVFLIEIVNMEDSYVDDSRTIYKTSVHAMVQFAD